MIREATAGGRGKSWRVRAIHYQRPVTFMYLHLGSAQRLVASRRNRSENRPRSATRGSVAAMPSRSTLRSGGNFLADDRGDGCPRERLEDDATRYRPRCLMQ